VYVSIHIWQRKSIPEMDGWADFLEAWKDGCGGVLRRIGGVAKRVGLRG
jgi:hypothetical protein